MRELTFIIYQNFLNKSKNNRNCFYWIKLCWFSQFTSLWLKFFGWLLRVSRRLTSLPFIKGTDFNNISKLSKWIPKQPKTSPMTHSVLVFSVPRSFDSSFGWQPRVKHRPTNRSPKAKKYNQITLCWSANDVSTPNKQKDNLVSWISLWGFLDSLQSFIWSYNAL